MNEKHIHWLRPLFGWAMADEESGDDDGDESRALAGRILFAVLWLPLQITVSLLFATGGIFILLILGIVFAPFIGVFFLIRYLVTCGDGAGEGNS